MPSPRMNVVLLRLPSVKAGLSYGVLAKHVLEPGYNFQNHKVKTSPKSKQQVEIHKHLAGKALLHCLCLRNVRRGGISRKELLGRYVWWFEEEWSS